MAARTASFALRMTTGLGLAAALLLAGCGSTGVGVGMAASNQGAAVGLSVGTPNTESTSRKDWPALPPPQWMTPEERQAARQEPTPVTAPAGTTPSADTPKP